MPGRDMRSGEPSDRDDASLMAGVRGGSTAAFEHVLQRYWAALVRYAARQLGDVDLAKDVVQEVFIQVWCRRAEWQVSGSVKAYLYTVTRSLVIDEQRRRKVRIRWAERTRHDDRIGPPTPVQLLGEAEARSAYERALGLLPARRREVFDLVHSRGLSHQEAAAIMGVSVQTVANQMSAALAHLRRAVQSAIDDATSPPPPTTA